MKKNNTQAQIYKCHSRSLTCANYILAISRRQSLKRNGTTRRARFFHRNWRVVWQRCQWRRHSANVWRVPAKLASHRLTLDFVYKSVSEFTSPRFSVAVEIAWWRHFWFTQYEHSFYLLDKPVTSWLTIRYDSQTSVYFQYKNHISMRMQTYNKFTWTTHDSQPCEIANIVI